MLQLLNYEKPLWSQNIDVAGIDEVGRGCLAGPLVAATVKWNPQFILEAEEKLTKLLPENFENIPKNLLTRKLKKSLNPHDDLYFLIQINDSKKITEPVREILAQFIKEHAQQIYIAEISNQEIDEGGVGEANKKAFQLCAQNMPLDTHFLTDHFILRGFKHTPITKGDSQSLSIAAASIIAKVYRDNLMKTKYHEQFPLYGFDKNVGYGTAEHLAVIRQNGYSDIHRRSFSIR